MGGKGQHKKQGHSLQQWPVIKFTHFCEIENKHVTAKMEAGLTMTLLGFTASSTTFRIHSEVATMAWALGLQTENIPHWLAILEQATVPTPKVLD